MIKIISSQCSFAVPTVDRGLQTRHPVVRVSVVVVVVYCSRPSIGFDLAPRARRYSASVLPPCSPHIGRVDNSGCAPESGKGFCDPSRTRTRELARSDRSITRPGHSRATSFGSHFSFPFVVERNIDISIMPLPALCSPSLCLVVLPCTPCYAPTTIAGLISAGPTTSEVHKFFKRDLLRNLPAWAEHTLAQQRQ